MVETEIQRNGLRQQISRERFEVERGSQIEWNESKEALSLFVESASLDAKHRIYKAQCQRSKDEDGQTFRRSYVQLVLSGRRGHGLASSRGSTKQSKFRERIIQAYATRKDDWIWCPVLSMWRNPEDMIAAHIFNYSHGQDTMDAIFGATEEPELFHPRNGMIVSRVVAEHLDMGLLAIVPDLPGDSGAEDILRWRYKGAAKDFKIKVVNPKHPSTQRKIACIDKTILELDNKKLEFRNDFRPRARYLFFHYAKQLLRVAFAERFQGQVSRGLKEFRKGCWGSPGHYIRMNMLSAFIEEIVHTTGLDVGAADEEGEGDENVMLMAALRDIDERDSKDRCVMGEARDNAGTMNGLGLAELEEDSGYYMDDEGFS